MSGGDHGPGYVWCGRCGAAIEPEIRDRLHPYCRACREDPGHLQESVLGHAVMSLQREDLRGLPHD